MRVEIPEKMAFLFRPARYKVAHGGRGGLKSWNYARALIILASQKALRILCAREFQNSIKESVHHLIVEQIELLGLSSLFKITDVSITSACGAEFIFMGIRNNPTKIKSTEGIDICWVEEAETISEESWKVLIPTIRKAGSEIWVTFNPNLETDPTYKRFVYSPPPNAVVVQTSWRDNPWLSDELRMEKDYLARVDPDAYAHVWEGGVNKRSNSLVLGGKYHIEAFEPEPNWDGPYFGADWGFAQDPLAALKMYIHDKKLYIRNESWGIGVELDDIPERFRLIPEIDKHVIRGDNSRPETISYLQRHGFPKITAADKWPGSVEDGVAFLRSFEAIVIHPECRHTAEEARLYSYKVDRLTGDVLPVIVDANNHCWDAARYALQPLIKNTGFGLFDFVKNASAEVETRKAESKKKRKSGLISEAEYQEIYGQEA